MEIKLNKIGIVFLLGVFFSTQLFAFDHSHALFDSVLKKAVVLRGSQSVVKYGDIKSNPDELNQYVAAIEAVTKSEYEGWNEKQQIAFLTNAYNALTIKLILTKYPDLDSIKDIGGFFTNPWKIKFFTLFGEKSYLDYIEHEILRVDFVEPRIHVGLVCAAKSCPPLWPEAYTADKLDQQFDDRLVNFLRDPQRNRFNQEEKELELSSIFKWFKKDFLAVAKSVPAYVAPWITDDPEGRRLLESGDVDLDYLDYDWSLNRAE